MEQHILSAEREEPRILCLVKISFRNEGEIKILQATFLTEDSYLEYTKNCQNSTVKNKLVRKWAKALKIHFTEEGICMANKQCKDVQHHQPLGKCKLKP